MRRTSPALPLNLLLLAALGACAQAVPQAANPGGGDALAAEFDRYCLQGFPADPVPQNGARLEPLSAQQVRGELKIDPGRGWVDHTQSGDFIVTIEDPPVKACAVRRLYRNPPAFHAAYTQRIEAWATQTGYVLQEGPPVRNQIGGDLIEGRTRLVSPVDRQPETLMALQTHYTDGTVEVRLVHQRAIAAPR